MTPKPQPNLPSPPSFTKRFMRYLLGFGVSVAIGLAPFLGQLDVPLFKSLLTILPPDERAVAVPLSATLMGTVAVAVQWYGAQRWNKRGVRRAFSLTLVAVLVALLIF